jgi:hypothetical protein
VNVYSFIIVVYAFHTFYLRIMFFLRLMSVFVSVMILTVVVLTRPMR